MLITDNTQILFFRFLGANLQEVTHIFIGYLISELLQFQNVLAETIMTTAEAQVFNFYKGQSLTL